MDANKLAHKYVCMLCGTLPKDPYFASDGYVYHKFCIEKKVFQNVGLDCIVSPVTNSPMGPTLIFAKTIKSLIKKCVESGGVDEEILGEWRIQTTRDVSQYIKDIKNMAEEGSPKHMALLSRWYLFGEQEGVDRDENEGYKWCDEAARKNDKDGMAYKGLCYVHGMGIQRNKTEGLELLIEAANEGSDFAAYKLGCYYFTGVHAFKKDDRRAEKYLTKAKTLEKNRTMDSTLSKEDVENIDRHLKVLALDAEANSGGGIKSVGGGSASLSSLKSASNRIEPRESSSSPSSSLQTTRSKFEQLGFFNQTNDSAHTDDSTTIDLNSIGSSESWRSSASSQRSMHSNVSSITPNSTISSRSSGSKSSQPPMEKIEEDN